MKKKKNTSLPEMPQWLAWVLVIVSLLLLVFYAVPSMFREIAKMVSFDSEEDVCQEWSVHNIQYDYTYTFSDVPKDALRGFTFDSLPEVNKVEGERNGWLFKCTKYRPKTICEKDSNAEGCICDEYEKEIRTCLVSVTGYITPYYPDDMLVTITAEDIGRKCFTNYRENYIVLGGYAHKMVNYTLVEKNITISKTCIESHLPPTPIKIDPEKEKCVEHTNESGEIVLHLIDANMTECKLLSIWCRHIKEGKLAPDDSCESYDKYCCLKKEPKNECEKNNPDWIWDEKQIKKACNEYGCATGDAEHRGMEETTFNNKGVNITNIYVNKFCRKKELKDLSCEELKECIFDKMCGYLFKESIGLFGVSRSYYYTIIEFEFIERCGGKR